MVACGDSADSAKQDAMPLSCTQARAEFESFVAANAACETVADCRVVGFVRDDCDCDHDYFMAVSADAHAEAAAYLPRIQSCVPGTCDDWFEPKLACEEGSCQAGSVLVVCPALIPPPDAAPTLDATAADGGAADGGAVDGGAVDAQVSDAGS